MTGTITKWGIILLVLILLGLFLSGAGINVSAKSGLNQILMHYNYLPLTIKSPPSTPEPTSTPTPEPSPTNPQTPEPPATSTATHTPTPTITPIATQPPPPSGVVILPNDFYFTSSTSTLHVLGEVANNTANHLRFVRIAANLFDDGGNLVDTDFTYIYLDNLPSGEKTCFDLLFFDPPANWSHYEFEAPSYWTDGEAFPNLTILNDSASYDPTFGDYEIIGQVRNDHVSRVEFVQPVGTLYTATGTVVGCDFTYVNSTHLDPNQVSSFKLSFFGRDYADVSSYRLQVDGNPQ